MKKIIKIIGILIITAAALVFGLSAYVVLSEEGKIAVSYKGGSEEISQEEIDDFRTLDPQCILVLGCAVRPSGEPSAMLRDRLDTAVALYKAGVAPKILMSGDNGLREYNEPMCMLKYALAEGVPAEDIFLDFAGFSTYESVYRAKEVFCADRLIVVTQKYHIYRALSICDALGINALGASADQKNYVGQFYRGAREVIARDKDFVKCITKPEPTFLGGRIPVSGDGTTTHISIGIDEK